MAENNQKPFFKFDEQLAHYKAVANGSKPTKDSEKYTATEQQAYARGQRDARNQLNRRWKRQDMKVKDPNAVNAYDIEKAQKQLKYWGDKKKEDPTSEKAVKKLSWWSNRLKDVSK